VPQKKKKENEDEEKKWRYKKIICQNSAPPIKDETMGIEGEEMQVGDIGHIKQSKSRKLPKS
jgi:hypothetical protein